MTILLLIKVRMRAFFRRLKRHLKTGGQKNEKRI